MAINNLEKEAARKAIHSAQVEVIEGDRLYIVYRKKDGDMVSYHDVEVHELQYGKGEDPSHLVILNEKQEYKTLLMSGILQGRILKPAPKAHYFIHGVVIDGKLITAMGNRREFNVLMQKANQTRSGGIKCTECGASKFNLLPYHFVTFAIREYWNDDASKIPTKYMVSAAICSRTDKYDKAVGRYYSELRMRTPAAYRILEPADGGGKGSLTDKMLKEFLFNFPLTPEKLRLELEKTLDDNLTKEDKYDILHTVLKPFVSIG